MKRKRILEDITILHLQRQGIQSRHMVIFYELGIHNHTTLRSVVSLCSKQKWCQSTATFPMSLRWQLTGQCPGEQGNYQLKPSSNESQQLFSLCYSEGYMHFLLSQTRVFSPIPGLPKLLQCCKDMFQALQRKNGSGLMKFAIRTLLGNIILFFIACYPFMIWHSTARTLLFFCQLASFLTFPDSKVSQAK